MATRQDDKKGPPMNQQQRGNTVLGFIIGVVVGLAAALAVAVYVTKVPVPFISKGQSRSADQDAAEAKKNKDWDPNAPLYGKTAAKPAPSASGAVTPAPAAPAAVVPAVAAAKPASGPAVPAVVAKPEAKVASADPLGDLAKSRMGATVEPFNYFVQVGAFRTAEDAEAQRAKLALSGVEAKVSEREQSGRTVFRVRTGPFDHKDDADKAKEKLDAAGLETALIRVAR